MSGNWVWLIAFGAAAGHALRWVPGNAAMRQVKIPASFAVLYLLYAGALVVGGIAGILVAFAVVELALQVVRRRRPGLAARTRGRSDSGTRGQR